MARRPTAGRSNESMTAIRQSIAATLSEWNTQPLAQGAIGMLAAMGYQSERIDSGFPAQPKSFIQELSEQSGYSIDPAKIQLEHWKGVELLFQLDSDDVTLLARGQQSLMPDTSIALSQIESFVFVAIELAGDTWSRTALTGIVRELNRTVQMPLIVLFRYGGLFSLAVISRRLHKRDAERDVLGSKITVIKDVRLTSPHAAHVHILASLELSVLQDQQPIASFNELYAAWLRQLSIKELNERFYKELQNWYLWARREVSFPNGQTLDEEGRPSVAVIRLLTRLIFVWFIKEKGLVPDDFFVVHRLAGLLKDDPRKNLNANNYYLAILQNLFFATLNVEMGKNRKWANTEGEAFQGKQTDRLVHGVYRHAELFSDAEQAKLLFDQVPFLNGGLFECLDRELLKHDLNNFDLVQRANKEGKALVLRVDGFSRRPEVQPQVPNKIFFGHGESVDLNDELNTKGKPYTADGLLDIFGRYKFTVDENTALDEEVALDPELLGKVFENLLASYNEDTKTTARKQSGSFYTPREVVDYMVDEAIIAYVLPEVSDRTDEAEVRAKLKTLLSYTETGNPFDVDETTGVMIQLAKLKILDPACGSGAFPMGALNKLVWVLSKLDPDNKLWRREHERRLNEQLKDANKQNNLDEVKALEAELKRLKDNFEKQTAEYTRKLYLIENSIYGVDIQPIAVQIAKLRFFIALIVSQQVDAKKANLGMLALPNLETRIVAANGLQPLFELGQQSLEDNSEFDVIQKKLKEKQAQYFRANTRTKKKQAQQDIEKLHEEIYNNCLLLQLADGTAGRLLSFRPFDQNSSSQFFDPSMMFGFAKFNLVIGNPPYVRHESIKPLKDQFKKNYACFTGTADLYVYFYEQSFNLLEPNGSFAFITSNKWYRAHYGAKLRDWMKTNTRIHQVIDFGDEAVFTALAYPTIVVASKRDKPQAPHADEQVQVLNWDQSTSPEVIDFPRIFEKHHFTVQQDSLQGSGWQLEPQGKRNLLAKIRAAGQPLGEYVKGQLYYGIKTGLNEAFVIDGATRAQLIEDDEKSAELIKPFLRGRDVKRWQVVPQDLWLIKIESSENKVHAWSNDGQGKPLAAEHAEEVFKQSYPAIQEHLNQFRQGLINRYDQGRFFWELRACAYWAEFEKPKIFVPAIETKTCFAVDQLGYFSNNKSTIFVSDEANFLAACLNTHLNTWLAFQICSGKQNGYYDFEPRYSSQLLIPNAKDTQKNILETLVDSIMQSTERAGLEYLMNGLVYELFFTEDVHAAGAHLFDTCTQIGLDDIDALAQHPTVLAQLATIHSLDDVQLIERNISTTQPAK